MLSHAAVALGHRVGTTGSMLLRVYCMCECVCVRENENELVREREVCCLTLLSERERACSRVSASNRESQRAGERESVRLYALESVCAGA